MKISEEIKNIEPGQIKPEVEKKSSKELKRIDRAALFSFQQDPNQGEMSTEH